MGHQILFYLSDRDTSDLENNLFGIDETVVLLDRFRGPFPDCRDTTDIVEHGQRRYFFYLARHVDLDSIVTKEVAPQGYWTIDDLRSPVIEFSRSRVNSDVIKRGRLYYSDTYYNGTGGLISKPGEFLKWSKKILSDARRLLSYDQELRAYLGKEAKELRKSGVKLVQF